MFIQVTTICFAKNKNQSAIVKIRFRTIIVSKSSYLCKWGGKWCCRASVGEPCGIGQNSKLRVGSRVVRCWLFDDRLWGSPFGVLGSEGGGGMDNDHSQECRVIQRIWGGYLVFNLGVLGGAWASVVEQCSLPQCRVRQQLNTKPHNKNKNKKNSNHLRITKVLVKTISLCVQIMSLGTVK